ncbi:MAG: hypothetical protein WCX30_03625 [Candidatus Paceibacterota bacterium]|jgi:hypothetical protein|nr:hypothetical protein [bacterium]
MHNIYRKFTGAFVFLLGLLFTSPAYAVVCQVCTVAVVAGSYLAREYGIDDAITGLWIGALTLLTCQWTMQWIELLLKKKNKKIKKGAKIVINTLVYILLYVLIVWPLHSLGIIGIANNEVFGIDKILFGIIAGTVVFFSAQLWYEEMKTNNNGKAFFPFQKVVMPVGSLILLSIIFYFFTKS